jgi:hypothetical protein
MRRRSREPVVELPAHLARFALEDWVPLVGPEPVSWRSGSMPAMPWVLFRARRLFGQALLEWRRTQAEGGPSLQDNDSSATVRGRYGPSGELGNV